MRILSLPTIVLLLCGSQSSALAASTTPARLLEGEHSIESLLRIPRGLEPGRYTVQCEAWVRDTGRIYKFTCYAADPDWDSLVGAVTVAGRKARFAAATSDGVPVDVLMLIMVRVDITAQGPLVLVVPNNGVEAERYGLLYTAPQRLNEFEWGRKVLASEVTNIADRPRRVLVWQKMRIDENGNVVDYVVTNSSHATPMVVRDIELGIQRMKFIPGLFRGKPVPMLYVEPAYSTSD